MNDLPLSDTELDTLEAFLDRDDLPDECMDLSMLDGYCTALAIAPNLLPPSQWLPTVWGETDEDAMEFETPAEMKRMTELVLRFYNDRIESLHEDIDEFMPLLYEAEIEGKSVPLLDSWCTGFINAITLDLAAWQPLVDSSQEEEGGLLTPMLLYGTDEGMRELMDNAELKERHQDFADAIMPCVLAIRDYWSAHRKAGSTFRREATKVGRNDPCPCGSGKKFKKCCGASETLH